MTCPSIQDHLIGRILHADEKQGIEYEEYRRLTENY